nr:hypothetical protein BaRGS_013532 [Batillaria attramentaria]
MIILNFFLFVIIAVGQILSLLGPSAATEMKRVGSSQKSVDMAIARRLFTIVISDFLCWFPIVVLEKRRKAYEKRMEQIFLSEMNARNTNETVSCAKKTTYTEEEAKQLMKTFLEQGHLTQQDLYIVL